jgi:hypothetical protein
MIVTNGDMTGGKTINQIITKKDHENDNKNLNKNDNIKSQRKMIQYQLQQIMVTNRMTKNDSAIIFLI